MEVSQIKTLIEGGENQEIEFKESFHSSQDISKVLCAFANTFGGVLLFGISNDKEVVGVTEDLDNIQQKISASNQSVSPAPLVSIECHKISNKNVVCVIVQRPADTSFYTYKGAIFVRSGSTNRRLEGQTQLEFLRNRQILSFDESYDPSAKLSDIDENKVKNYLKVRGQEKYLETRSIEEFLLSHKMASKNGTLKLKNPVTLLFGKEPSRFHPQNEIKLVQFQGSEAVEIIAHQLVQDDLVNSIEQTISFIKNHIPKRIKISEETRRVEVFEYPIDVIREAVVNAIAHRDYFSKDAIQIAIFSNRIEITSPGSLPQGLTKELFGTISVQRNPLSYRFLRDWGYVEGLGTGVPRIRNKMRKAGLGDPEFIFSDHFFRLILYNKKGRKKAIEHQEDLNDRQKKALSYLKKNKSIKSQTYSELNDVSKATAVNEINEMIHFGFLKKIGAFRGAYYVLENTK